MKKRCSKCRKLQAVNRFSKNATNPDGYDHYCKSCNKKRLKKYFTTPKGKAAMRRATIKRKKTGKTKS